jgi:hypothetical protein
MKSVSCCLLGLNWKSACQRDWLKRTKHALAALRTPPAAQQSEQCMQLRISSTESLTLPILHPHIHHACLFSSPPLLLRPEDADSIPPPPLRALPNTSCLPRLC